MIKHLSIYTTDLNEATGFNVSEKYWDATRIEETKTQFIIYYQSKENPKHHITYIQKHRLLGWSIEQ